MYKICRWQEERLLAIIITFYFYSLKLLLYFFFVYEMANAKDINPIITKATLPSIDSLVMPYEPIWIDPLSESPAKIDRIPPK